MLIKLSTISIPVLVLSCAVMRSESGPLMSVLGKCPASGFLKSGERITSQLLPSRLPLLPIRVITQIILNALDNHYQLDMIDVSVIIVRVN